MNKESFKKELDGVKRNARVRGVARTLDMSAAYSGRYVDTSFFAAASAIARDGAKVQADMKCVASKFSTARGKFAK